MSHLQDKSRSYDIVIAARRRLVKFPWCQLHNFARNISLECRSPPRLLPRTPPSQVMAVSRGSCGGRVLWRPHMPHPMLAMPSHVHGYPHGLPATVAILPAPIDCTYSRSKWAVQDYYLNTSSSSKIFRPGGSAWNLLDFDNQSAAIICVDTIN